MSSLPPSAAACSAVPPPSPLLACLPFAFAPASTRTRTIAASARSAATMSGVKLRASGSPAEIAGAGSFASAAEIAVNRDR